MLNAYNQALSNLRQLGKQLREISDAHEVLGNEEHDDKYTVMADTVETAVDAIREFVSTQIAPPSAECDRNIIEQ